MFTKAKVIVVLFVLLALGLSAASAQQNTPAPDALFTLVSEDPVVAHGVTPAWDGQYTDPGAVMVYDEGHTKQLPNRKEST
jgi:hypothetical protein